MTERFVDITAEEPIGPSRRDWVRHWFVGPPRLVLLLVVTAAAVLTLATSAVAGTSGTGLVVLVPVWLAIGLAWLRTATTSDRCRDSVPLSTGSRR